MKVLNVIFIMTALAVLIACIGVGAEKMSVGNKPLNLRQFIIWLLGSSVWYGLTLSWWWDKLVAKF